MTTQAETLFEFAARRLPVLEREVERLNAELLQAQQELATIRGICNADRTGIALPPAPLVEGSSSAQEMGSIRSRTRTGHADRTIKDAIISVLRDEGHALSAIEMLPKINALLGIDYPRTSLSPQLSRLKASKVVSLNHGKWALVEWAGSDEEYKVSTP